MEDFRQAPDDRAYGLIEAGRAEEALAISTALVAAAPADHSAIAVHAAALRAAGRKAEALPFNRRAVQLFPQSGVAWHNLAATLDDIGWHEAAIEAVERALSLGARSPATWLVYCHALMHLGDYAGAEAAFRKLLREIPGHQVAAQELARLVWVTTGDWRRATAPLRALREAGGPEQGAVLLEGRILQAAGCARELEALYAEALLRLPDDVILLTGGANAALIDGRLDQAAERAARAVVLAPNYAPALTTLTSIRLTQRRSADALVLARRAAEADPRDMSTWGWLATAARAAGDPAAAELFDYGAMVKTFRIEAPPGWPDREAFLRDLARALERRHTLSFEPPDQSVRGGAQTCADLSRSQVPELRALFIALDAPIRSYLESIGSGADPLRSRNTRRYRVDSAWSVRLRPNGFHENHFHAEGWISSAFYVSTPPAVGPTGDRQGWLKLGEPPAPLQPLLPPEHFVQPEPGLLVLFPSYMWHGTIPFSSEGARLSVAFDILPA